jgi:glycerol uptake facilitator-like aquaporin
MAPELSAGGNVMSAFATCGALVGLIMALGPVSGGHFNPLVTSLQWLLGQRGHVCTIVYCVAQVAGAVIGALLANSLGSRQLLSRHHPAATPILRWSCPRWLPAVDLACPGSPALPTLARISRVP